MELGAEVQVLEEANGARQPLVVLVVGVAHDVESRLVDGSDRALRVGHRAAPPLQLRHVTLRDRHQLRKKRSQLFRKLLHPERNKPCVAPNPLPFRCW